MRSSANDVGVCVVILLKWWDADQEIKGDNARLRAGKDSETDADFFLGECIVSLEPWIGLFFFCKRAVIAPCLVQSFFASFFFFLQYASAQPNNINNGRNFDTQIPAKTASRKNSHFYLFIYFFLFSFYFISFHFILNSIPLFRKKIIIVSNFFFPFPSSLTIVNNIKKRGSL